MKNQWLKVIVSFSVNIEVDFLGTIKQVNLLENNIIECITSQGRYRQSIADFENDTKINLLDTPLIEFIKNN